jgi:hypothetical protein
MAMSTTSPELREVVEELRALVHGDGADLRLLNVDDGANVIELALELEDVNCADCVLPLDISSKCSPPVWCSEA